MVAAVKFYNFVHYLTTKQMNLNSDTLKVMLTNTAPSQTNNIYSDVSAGDLATANGYTNGGGTVTGVSSTNSGSTAPVGTETVAGSAFTWTATGAIGPFRYAILYDSTSTHLTESWDYGSPVTMSNGDTFTWTPTGSVLLTLQ